VTALLVIIALLAPGGAKQPTAPTASAVLASVQKFYAGAKQLTATFVQTVTNTTFGTKKQNQGTLALAKPDKMRFDYERTKNGKIVPDKSFVYDGTTGWMVEPSNLKITKVTTQGSVLPVAVSFLTGAGDLGARFNVALDASGTYGATVLLLTPKQASAQFKQLFLVVEPKDGSVTASIVVAPSDDVNEFRFANVSTTTAPRPGTFQVDPKDYPNYKIETPQANAGSGATPKPAAPAKRP
jgi:outer membrane lipoprotein carrier protein